MHFLAICSTQVDHEATDLIELHSQMCYVIHGIIPGDTTGQLFKTHNSDLLIWIHQNIHLYRKEVAGSQLLEHYLVFTFMSQYMLHIGSLPKD